MNWKKRKKIRNINKHYGFTSPKDYKYFLAVQARKNNFDVLCNYLTEHHKNWYTGLFWSVNIPQKNLQDRDHVEVWCSLGEYEWCTGMYNKQNENSVFNF